MSKFRIITDAVTTTIQATDADAAAAQFARAEPVYRDYAVECVADLLWAAKQLGGHADVREVE